MGPASRRADRGVQTRHSPLGTLADQSLGSRSLPVRLVSCALIKRLALYRDEDERAYVDRRLEEIVQEIRAARARHREAQAGRNCGVVRRLRDSTKVERIDHDLALVVIGSSLTSNSHGRGRGFQDDTAILRENDTVPLHGLPALRKPTSNVQVRRPREAVNASPALIPASSPEKPQRALDLDPPPQHPSPPPPTPLCGKPATFLKQGASYLRRTAAYRQLGRMPRRRRPPPHWQRLLRQTGQIGAPWQSLCGNPRP